MPTDLQYAPTQTHKNKTDTKDMRLTVFKIGTVYTTATELKKTVNHYNSSTQNVSKLKK